MDTDIYLSLIAIAVIALDIIVRVFIYPGRRDRFYQALLEMQSGMPARRNVVRHELAVDEPLSEALLTYFQQSFTSRQVMTALALDPGGLPGKQLEQQIADHVAKKWNRHLSLNAIRRVLMILVGANLVEIRDGKFALTGIGWKLFQKTKSNKGPRWTETAASSLVHAQ